MIRPRTAAIILVVLYIIAGTIDYAAAAAYRFMLLETSGRAADLDECQRAFPGRGRPSASISYQQRTGEPWHHRTCVWPEWK